MTLSWPARRLVQRAAAAGGEGQSERGVQGGGAVVRRAPARRILVVDDEDDILEALEWTLRSADYDVVTARSGMEALAAARAGRFDLLVTDYRMPGMTGSETIQALKELDPDLHAIVATGYFSDETSAECRDRGAEGLIRKPFDLDELLELVDRILA